MSFAKKLQALAILLPRLYPPYARAYCARTVLTKNGKLINPINHENSPAKRWKKIMKKKPTENNLKQSNKKSKVEKKFD